MENKVKKERLHRNEKAFREKAETDPKRAEHLKEYPHPVKLKGKRNSFYRTK